MELTTGQNDPLYRGFMEALFCSVLIVLITFVLPEYGKRVFVADPGPYAVFPMLGPWLALALLLRWRRSRIIALGGAVVLALLHVFEALTLAGPYWGYGVLLALDGMLLYLLASRRDLRLYLREL